MKKETTLSVLIYIFGPVVRFIILEELVAAAMDFAWNSCLQDMILRSAGSAHSLRIQTMWSFLRLLLSAGAGCLSVRKEALLEKDAFVTAQKQRRLLHKGYAAFGETFKARTMPLLLSAVVLLALAINVLFSCIMPDLGSPQSFGNLPGIAGILLQAMLYCFFMPYVEETVFRGILYPRLQRGYGTRTAILGSAAFFGIYHGTLSQGIYALIMGLVFAAAYEAAGSFKVPFALHGACNLAVLLLQWTDTYKTFCKPLWAAVFTGTAVCGFFTINLIIKKTAE